MKLVTGIFLFCAMLQTSEVSGADAKSDTYNNSNNVILVRSDGKTESRDVSYINPASLFILANGKKSDPVYTIYADNSNGETQILPDLKISSADLHNLMLKISKARSADKAIKISFDSANNVKINELKTAPLSWEKVAAQIDSLTTRLNACGCGGSAVGEKASGGSGAVPAKP